MICRCLRTHFLAVALCLLCGCGISSTAPDSRSVHLVVLNPGGVVEEACAAEIAQFRRNHPDITVESITAPGNEYYTKALTMMAGRAHVDVAWMGQGFQMFATRRALLDLNPFLASDMDFHIADYYAPVVNWYRYDGRLYGVPYGIDAEVIAFNQDQFDAAGLAYPDDTWTWDQLVEAAKKLTVREGGRVARYGLNIGMTQPGLFGASILTSDQQRFALNSPAGIEWLQFNLDLLRVHRVKPASNEQETMDRITAFLMGRAAIVDCYTWDLEELRKRAQFRWDVAVVPVAKQRCAWGSSAGWVIPAHTRHPKEAWMLLKQLVGKEFQQRKLRDNVPTMLTLQGEFVRANPTPKNSGAFVRSLPWLQPTPHIGCQQEILAELDHWNDRVFVGQMPPAEALVKAETKVNAIIEEYRNR